MPRNLGLGKNGVGYRHGYDTGSGGIEHSTDLVLRGAAGNSVLTLQETGIGASVCTHTSAYRTPDYEGVLRTVAANEVPWQGGRVVENLALRSDDVSHAAWTKALGAVADDSNSVTFDGTTNGNFRQAISTSDASTLIFSVELKLESGSPSSDAAMNIVMYGNMTASTVNIGSDITSEWQRFYVTATTTSTGTSNIQVVSDDALTVGVRGAQLENATGRADTTTPSEYIATSASAATRHFRTENSLTVRDNVVYDDGEFVRNGAGDSTDDWVVGGLSSDLSVDSGQFVVAHNGTNYGSHYYTIETVVGVDYELSGDFIYVDSGGWLIKADNINYSVNRVDAITNEVVNTSSSVVFTATATTTYIHIVVGISGTSRYDNISVKRVGAGKQIDRDLLSDSGPYILSTASWTGNDAAADLAVKKGVILVRNGDASAAHAYQSTTIQGGRKYTLEWNIKGGNAAAKIYIGTSAGASDIYDSGSLALNSGLDSYTFYNASTQTVYVSLVVNSTTSGDYVGFFEARLHQVEPFSIVYPARTNLLLQNSTLGTTWSNTFFGGITLTEDAAVAPNGLTEADELAQVDSTSDGIYQDNLTLASSTEYVVSGYFKNVDSTQSRLRVWDNNVSAQLADLTFDWTSGVPSTNTSTAASNILYEPVGNAWWRISYSFTTAGTVTTHSYLLNPESSATATNSIYFWGGQLELGKAPGSAIATTTASTAIDATVTYWDGENLNLKSGLLSVEMIPFRNQSALPSHQGLFTTGSTVGFMYDNLSGGSISTRDGTTTVSTSTAYEAGKTIRVVNAFGQFKMAISTDSNLYNTGVFDNEYAIGSDYLRVGSGATDPFGFRNVQFFDVNYEEAVQLGVDIREGYLGSQDQRVFYAATEDPSDNSMTPQLDGYGYFSGTHTSTIYAPDYEGVYRDFGANEAVWKGGRVVENLNTSADAVVGGVTVDSLASASDDVVVISGFTTVNGDRYHIQVTPLPSTGEVTLPSLEIKANSAADVGKDVIIRLVQSGGTSPSTHIYTLTADYVRVTAPPSTMDGGSTLYLWIYGASSNNASGATIKNVQIEDATGRSDTTTPSEYIPTTTAAVQKVYATENDLAVRSNVVYEDGEYVTNGTFDADTNWTKDSGWTIADGVTTSDGSNGHTIRQTANIVAGEYYVVSFDVTARTAGSVRVRLGGATSLDMGAGTVGSFSAIHQAEATDSNIRLVAYSSFAGSVDNFSVKRLNSGDRIDKELITNGGVGAVVYPDGYYADFNGVAADYIQTPDAAANDITGDIDIRVKVALDDWTPATRQPLVTKFDGAVTGWLFEVVNTSGVLRIFDGTSNIPSTSAPTVTDGDTLWVRVTHDVDNGAAGRETKFYTSSDGSTWTQLGDTVTTATAVALENAVEPVEIGGWTEGTTATTGKIYEALVFDGIDGDLVVSFNAEENPDGESTHLSTRTREEWTWVDITVGTDTPLSYEYTFTDTTGWTGNDAGALISINGGNLRVENGDATQAYAYTSITTIAGRRYEISASLAAVSAGTAILRAGTSAGASDLFSQSGISVGEYQYSFVATGTTTYISLWINSITSGITDDWEYIRVHQRKPYLQHSVAATNLVTDSRDLTGWGETGTPVDTYDQVGITGEANTATYLEDDDAAAIEAIQSTVTTSSNTLFSARAWYKKDAVTSRYPSFGINVNAVWTIIHIDTQNGTVQTEAGAGGNSSQISIHSDGDWWVVCIEETAASADTSILVRIDPARATTQGSGAVVAAVGSTIVGNVELYENTTLEEIQYAPPIFTSSGTAAIDRTVYRYDLANHSDTQGLWFMDWYPGYDAQTGLGHNSIVTTGAGGQNSIFYDSTAVAGRIGASDATNYSNSTTIAWSATDQVPMATAFGSSSMITGHLGAYGTAVSYDGGFNQSSFIEIGLGHELPFCFSDLQFWRWSYKEAKRKGTEESE